MKKLLLLFLLIQNISFAQEEIVWDYPIKPGSEEWKTLKSYDKQLQAYNIPQEILKKISTAELVKTCLSYPEWRLINAYDNRRIGLNNVTGLFNGFNELFTRNDAAKELIKKYAEMDPLTIGENWIPIQKGDYSFQFTCVEMLLSHPAIIEKLSSTDRRTLLDVAVNNYRRKRQLPEVYSLWGLSPTAGLCLNVLSTDGGIMKNDSDIALLQMTFMSNDIKILDTIIDLAEKK